MSWWESGVGVNPRAENQSSIVVLASKQAGQTEGRILPAPGQSGDHALLLGAQSLRVPGTFSTGRLHARRHRIFDIQGMGIK